MKLFLALALLLAAQAQAQAQAIRRCGLEGRSYADTPCADGRLLAADDTRSQAQVQAARAVAASEARLADQLRQERLRRDALPAPTPAKAAPRKAASAALAPRPPSWKSKRRPPADPDIFRAVAPASRQKQG